MTTTKGDCSNKTPDPPKFPPELARCKSPKCCNKPERIARGLAGPKDYKNEPKDRSKLLHIDSLTPYHGEPAAPVLLETFLTPEPIFFKCNHGPVATLADPIMYDLEISGLLPKPANFYLDAILAMPKSRVPVTLMCAGNRRTGMHQQKKILEIPWGNAAVGTAVWGGVRLADLLKMQGIPYRTLETDTGGRYVEFISVDYMKETPDEPFKSSIPLIHATTPRADILLAYEMNYEELPREHGYPLRVIIPGCIGARSVKWLKEIRISKDECQDCAHLSYKLERMSLPRITFTIGAPTPRALDLIRGIKGFYMQKHFKHYPPHLELDPPWVTTVDWYSRRPMMEFPVQSAICIPHDGISLPKGAKVTIRGYAIAGGGRAIDRVDVSVNCGRSWEDAERRQGSFPVPLIPCPCCGTVPPKVEIFDPFEADGVAASLKDPQLLKWTWVFWEHVAQVDPPTEIIVKAVDSACNVQPKDMEHIWNFRGVNNNCWHRVKVNLKTECVPTLPGLLRCPKSANSVPPMYSFSSTDCGHNSLMFECMNLNYRCKENLPISPKSTCGLARLELLTLSPSHSVSEVKSS